MSTISGWSTISIKQFYADIIATWCEYFDWKVGDLIVYEGDSKDM
jgi:DNA-binding Xre family transcriptional regulator